MTLTKIKEAWEGMSRYWKEDLTTIKLDNLPFYPTRHFIERIEERSHVRIFGEGKPHNKYIPRKEDIQYLFQLEEVVDKLLFEVKIDSPVAVYYKDFVLVIKMLQEAVVGVTFHQDENVNYYFKVKDDTAVIRVSDTGSVKFFS